MRIKSAILGCSAALAMTAGLAGTAAADGDTPSPKPSRPSVICAGGKPASGCVPPFKQVHPIPGQPTYTG